MRRGFKVFSNPNHSVILSQVLGAGNSKVPRSLCRGTGHSCHSNPAPLLAQGHS